MLGFYKGGFYKPLFPTIFLSLFVITLTSCSTSREDHSKIVNYQIPISSKQTLTYSKAFISGNTFYGYNRNHFGIDEIDLDTNRQKPAKLAVQFEQQGPNEVASPWHMATYQGDIYLWDSYGYLIVLGNSYKIKKQQHFHFEANGIKLGFGNGYTVNTPKTLSISQGSAIIPLYKLIPRSTKGYYDSLYFAEINLTSLAYQIKTFPLPEEFNENYWPIHDEYFIQKLAEDQFIISFKAMATVFKAEGKQLVKRFELNLKEFGLNQMVSSLPKSYDQIAAYRNFNYSRGSQVFLPLRYNASKNEFYRVVKGETDGSSAVARKNLHLFKYDRNFNLINYTKLPDGYLADFILDRDKLYFQQSEVTAKNEKVLRLSLIHAF